MSYTGAVPDTLRPADWRTEAACRGQQDAMFPGTLGHDIERAKSFCRRCPAIERCLQWALETGTEYGVWGGLTEDERASIQRAKTRRSLTPDKVAARTEAARQPPEKPRTLQSIFDASTTRLHGGHMAWTGQRKISFHGKTLTPKQLCFTLGRGHHPDGPVRSDCGIDECVLPSHLADTAERAPKQAKPEERAVYSANGRLLAECGTRSAYSRHVKNGEPIDDACRRANTDADNRLRRTGTTKALA